MRGYAGHVPPYLTEAVPPVESSTVFSSTLYLKGSKHSKVIEPVIAFLPGSGLSNPVTVPVKNLSGSSLKIMRPSGALRSPRSLLKASLNASVLLAIS